MELDTIKDAFERVAKKQKLSCSRTQELIEQMRQEIESAVDKVRLTIDTDSQSDFKSVLSELKSIMSSISPLSKLEGTQKELNVALSKYVKLLEKSLNPHISKAYRNINFDTHVLNQIIASHLYQQGLFDVSDYFIREAGEPESAAMKAPFLELYHILEAMKSQDLEPALSWASTNANKFDKGGSDLLLKLHGMQFLNILQNGSKDEALQYARTHLAPFSFTFINYYMYHGGTNFGRTAGGPFIATSYDYDAPLDEYGLMRQPKWGHLKDLHRAIKLCEPALVSGNPTVTPLGNYQEAHVFKSKSGACAAFLANYNPNSYSKVTFGNMHYNLPPWSISILPDCKITVYNTARVGSQSAQMKMTPVPRGTFSWQAFNEQPSSDGDTSFTVAGLLEQINTTRDVSDYLWYTTDVKIDPDEAFLRNGKDPFLTVLSAGHTLHVFINGQLAGTGYGSLKFPKLTFSQSVELRAGINKIALLSVAVGLPNIGPHFETWNAGVLGPVTLNGLNEGKRDLSWQKWSYKVGLKGEDLSLHSISGSSSVEWFQGAWVSKKQPMTWYKTTFNAPAGNSPLALDMISMGKGQIWINGQNIGRYWPAYKASGSCGYCDYTGTYNENKCVSNCGEASQRWYHVPRSWLKPTGNLLVVFEESGGDPNGILMVRREIGSVCAYIYEWQPTLTNGQLQSSGKVNGQLRPKVHLSCGSGQKISSIKFASFGTPEGMCGNYHEGSCHAHKSYDPYQRNCIGQNWCTVTVSPENFGGDPCPTVMKRLAVEAVCS